MLSQVGLDYFKAPIVCLCLTLQRRHHSWSCCSSASYGLCRPCTTSSRVRLVYLVYWCCTILAFRNFERYCDRSKAPITTFRHFLYKILMHFRPQLSVPYWSVKSSVMLMKLPQANTLTKRLPTH